MKMVRQNFTTCPMTQGETKDVSASYRVIVQDMLTDLNRRKRMVNAQEATTNEGYRAP